MVNEMFARWKTKDQFKMVLKSVTSDLKSLNFHSPVQFFGIDFYTKGIRCSFKENIVPFIACVAAVYMCDQYHAIHASGVP